MKRNFEPYNYLDPDFTRYIKRFVLSLIVLSLGFGRGEVVFEQKDICISVYCHGVSSNLIFNFLTPRVRVGMARLAQDTEQWRALFNAETDAETTKSSNRDSY